MNTGDRSGSDVVGEVAQNHTVLQGARQIIRQLHLQSRLDILKHNQ